MEWVLGRALKEKLDSVLSPTLENHFGVAWRGDNTWVEPCDSAARRMIWLMQLKGLRAVVGWGYSMSFVPRISGSRLSYHRTFKSANADIFEWPESYSRSFSVATTFKYVDLSASKFDRSLASFFDAEIPSIGTWFEGVRNLEGIEQELRRQISNPAWSYRLHHPSPAYVLPFVVAALGKIEEAEGLAQTGFDERLAPFIPDLRLALRRVPVIRSNEGNATIVRSSEDSPNVGSRKL